ncbi:MAG: lamin tail domain-containing protein [Candidatus Magasanikbacteria bacterium]|nr:lamin tail domain-containing protein [Candidatus Magasanikbacteria bacterium]
MDKLPGQIWIMTLLLAIGLIGMAVMGRRVYAAVPSTIAITEIAAYLPAGAEWIELYNFGSAPIDLAGWKFWENNTSHNLKPACRANPCAAAAIIGPQQFAVIAQNAAAFWADYPAFTGLVLDSSWGSLTEKGEEIGLKDTAGNFVEQFTYLPATRASLERLAPERADYTAANWRERDSGHSLGALTTASAVSPASSASLLNKTTAKENSAAIVITPVASATSAIDASTSTLALSELLPKPRRGEEEFIELFNRSAESIQLDGWQVAVGRQRLALAGRLEAGEFLLLNRSLSDLTLSDTSSTVRLIAPNGLTSETISYQDAPTGASYNLAESGEWRWSALPTRGTTNLIVPPDTVNVLWNISAPPTIEVNKTARLDAAGSLDPRGGRLNFTWHFADGLTLAGNQVERRFGLPGEQRLAIIASSTAGTISAKPLTINILAPDARPPAEVVINEILPNPADAESQEFIELYNRGAAAVDLSGWQLYSGEDSFELPAETVAPAEDYLLFPRRITKLVLANEGGAVTLETAEGVAADTVRYGRAPAGASYAREENGWQWSARPTPGEFNQLLPLTDKKEESPARPIVNPKKSNAGSAPLVNNIPAARSATKGTKAILTGAVAALPGTFGAQYFYLTGADGGIAIFSAKKLFPALSLGDRVQVQGVISTANGRPRINVRRREDIQKIKGSVSDALIIATSTIADLADFPLGSLVQVTGEITEIKSGRLYLDDGSGEVLAQLKRGARINQKRLPEGSSAAITGILEEGASGQELWPLGDQDIKIITKEKPSTANLSLAPKKPNKSPAIYALITVFGLLILLAAWRWRRTRA